MAAAPYKTKTVYKSEENWYGWSTNSARELRNACGKSTKDL